MVPIHCVLGHKALNPLSDGGGGGYILFSRGFAVLDNQIAMLLAIYNLAWANHLEIRLEYK